MSHGICKELYRKYFNMSSATNNFKLHICTFWQQNRCRHGPTCRFAHGVKELRNLDGSLVYPPSVTVNAVPKKVTPKKKPQKKVKPVKKASFAVLFEDSDSDSDTETETESSESEEEHEVIPIKNSGKQSWYDMMQEEFGDNWPLQSNNMWVC